MKTRFNPFQTGERGLPARPAAHPAQRTPKRKPKARAARQKRPSVDAQIALSRAVSGQSLANYPAIIEGFKAKGIPEDQIKPRENVFTFDAWKALGRVVRKGEHGVKIATCIPIGERETGDVDPETGEPVKEMKTRPWTSTVFHISQTDPIETAAGTVAGSAAGSAAILAVPSGILPDDPVHTSAPAPAPAVVVPVAFTEPEPQTITIAAAPAPAAGGWRARRFGGV